MGMSQEEIKALMNSLDINENPPNIKEEKAIVDIDELEELISQNGKIKIQEVDENIEEVLVENESQILETLNLALDNSNSLKNKIKSFDTYVNTQLELLNSLCTKFPNIEVFNTQKKLSNQMILNLEDINEIVDLEDKQIHKVIELIQSDNKDKQKIEKIIPSIKKLTICLNDLFTDDILSEEIANKKSMHSNKNQDLISNDLDKLIDELANKDK